MSNEFVLSLFANLVSVLLPGVAFAIKISREIGEMKSDISNIKEKVQK